MFSQWKSVNERFFAVARHFPESPSVVFREAGLWQNWSYAVLARRARTIAAYLAASGVEPGDVVGLVAGRYPDALAAMIGILECGGQYLPLDASYPEQRLALLCRDANVRHVLSATALAPGQRMPLAVTILAGDLGDTLGAPALDTKDATVIPPDSPAYIMFTSGSTGEPKGVVVPHRAIIRLIDRPNFVTLDQSCAFMHLAPQSFDACTLEIWGPLLNGGRCVLYPEDLLPTAAGLRSVISATGANRLWLTSSLFNSILDQDPQCFSGVEELLTGGEALSVPHVSKALTLLPRTRLINGYGPTENTTFTTCYRIPPDFPADSRSVPIGFPITGTEVVIVDQALNPVARGQEGELIATGEGLALGYLNRPQLNAERFVNVTTATGAVRGYRSGDRVAQRPDGACEFFGRFDDQVKIEGHRIEPGEIERAAANLPGVKACRVLVRTGPSGQKRLAAYVVTDGPLGETEFRAALGGKLPSFMVPHFVFFVPAIPTNANGKLDRDALPDPFRSERVLVAPASSSIAERVAAAWREVLGSLPQSEDVNFFEAGGTSLEAVKLFDVLCTRFERDLEPTFVFRYPTIRRQTDHLRPDVGRADMTTSRGEQRRAAAMRRARRPA